jgi:hypothetical protein
MANHCFNGISFYGKDLTKIKEMIADAIVVNETQGWLPTSIDVSKLNYPHYMFDIEINGETEDSISFACWTKWGPPIEELEYICKEANVSATCWYEESGMGIYGQAKYDLETDYTTDVRLTDEEVNRVQYDEKKDVYLLDGKPIESDSEAYEKMLDQKIDALKSEAK